MSQRRSGNVLDVEKGISDSKTPVHVERTSRRTSKQSAWIQDETEDLISLKLKSAVRQVCDNEAESSFITSPTRSSVSTVGSSRQRRREMTATGSPSVGHSAKTDTVEDIRSLRRDKSSTPVSSLSWKNKDTLDHLNKDETESKDVMSIGSRHSLGESSAEGSRSFTPQSDSRSYRDRLRDRFQAVRERAGTSVIETHTRSHLRRRRLTQPSGSCFDDLLRKEEAQVGDALERHKEVKAKWKGTIQAVQQVLCCNMLYNFHSDCISSLHYIACNKCIGKCFL